MVPCSGEGAAVRVASPQLAGAPVTPIARRAGAILTSLPAPVTGLIRPHQSKLAMLNRVSDAAWVWVGLGVALWLLGHSWGDRHTLAAALGGGLFMLCAELRSAYRGWRGAPLAEELGRLASAWLIAAVLLVMVGFAVHRSHHYSRLVIGSWFLLTLGLVAAWRISMRLGLRELRRRGRNIRTVAVAGAGELGARVMETMTGTPWMGMKPIGFYDDRKPKGHRPLDERAPGVLGNLDDLVKRAVAGEVDIVYLALPLRAEERTRQVIAALSDSTATVYLVPDVFCFDLLHAQMVNFAGLPAVSVFENPFNGVNGLIKRLEDLVLATLILLLVALPMAVIALGVKLSSRGPVFFKQRRYGLDGKEIVVWKFRTMSVCEDGPEFTQAIRHDPRVTRLGAFLRRTSLDELPQFFNVLGGTMSVVGPRPHPVAMNETYRKLIRGYMLRHKVKPGITGWAQIRGFRGETDKLEKMERRIEHDLWYIRNWSLGLDLRIVALSAVRGFGGENCY